MTEVWLLFIIVALIIEALTFNLITIWIALGSLIAYITSYITGNETIQITVFTVVTITSILFTRKFVKKFISVNTEKTNIDAVIGKIGIVVKDIENEEVGRVKVMGKNWSAISFDEKTIKEGSKVEILKIQGVKLVVKEGVK